MINKNYGNGLTKADKILIANILDKYYVYFNTHKSTYSNFLNQRQLKLVISYLQKEKIPYSIYEPYPFLEKKIIYFGKYLDFVTFYQGDTNGTITHQQILGNLFSLGFEEDTIGDIIVEKDYFYFTNLSRLNTYLEENFSLVNGKQINLHKVEEIVLTENHFEPMTILVRSMRLDIIISRISGKSRNQVISMIEDKMVLLNYEEVRNSCVFLKTDDILSVRRIGKFKIGEIKGYTKKQNIILNINRYK